MKVRKAGIDDLPTLVQFTREEAREAERGARNPENIEKGVLEALRDVSKAIYWILADESDTAIGSISALKEWSDWNAGYYWWIQSVYIVPDQRGKGLLPLLLDTVESEMKHQGGLELRLYVHGDNRRAIEAYRKFAFEKLPYEIMVRRAPPDTP